MKRLRLALGLLTVLLMPMSSAVAVGQGGILPPSASTASEQQRYEQSMEERLRKLGKDLDDLKARTGSLADRARQEADKYIADAERKRKAAAEKLEVMRAESRKRWETFSRELNAAMDDLEKGFDRARSRFGGEASREEEQSVI